MKKEVNKVIPIKFEMVEDYDSRFQKIKIWLMHTGQNYNRSYFDKEVVEEYMHTVKNTPLLGFIEEDSSGNKDFKGHEEILVIKDGEFGTKYLGSAYGVIPESCNPRFETKEGDDGIFREYLVVDGLMWTKFDDAVEILNINNEVSQSMELSDEYDGYWDENNIFHFTKFKFDGACMLGKDVLPAMEKASVEKQFSVNELENQIKDKLVEFANYINNKFSKEVKDLTVEELLAKYNITMEDLAEKEINVENFSLEELEVEIKEKFSTEENSNEEVTEEGSEEQKSTEENFTEDSEETETENEENSEENTESTEEETDEVEEDYSQKEKNKDKFSRVFELSHDDIRSKMYAKLDSHLTQSLNKGEDVWAYIVAVYETYIIAEDDWGNEFYMIKYGIENEDVQFGEVSQVYPMFLTSDEKGALELMRSNFEAFEKENTELKEFKASIEKEIHSQKAEELFSQFDKLTEEDISELRANVHNFSIEELEAKTFEILGRKMSSKFTKKDVKNPISIKFSNNKDGMSSFDKYFEKHGIKK